MIVDKKSLLMLGLGLVLCLPAYGQKFSKRVQARREARAANYFYGTQFTVTGGYEHSWMKTSPVALSGTQFGRSAKVKNAFDAFNIGFLYDQAFTRRWGLQTGLYYSLKGGEKWTYADQGLGYGPIEYAHETLRVPCVELQSLGRFFVPIGYDWRVSVNLGGFLDKMIDKPTGFRDWDYGAAAGVGCDWRHLSFSVNYRMGLNEHLVKTSNARLNALSVNVGFRFWKE